MNFQDVHWDSIEEAQAFITNWAQNNFPGRTAHQALAKLVLEEIPEMLQEVKEREKRGEEVDRAQLELEFADTLILLFDLASLWRINIPRALREKMQINMHRMWLKNEAGIYQHVVINQTVDQAGYHGRCQAAGCNNTVIAAGDDYCPWHECDYIDAGLNECKNPRVEGSKYCAQHRKILDRRK